MTSAPPVEGHSDIRTASSPDTLGAYPRALVESMLDKVLGSTVFRRSDRHRRLLRHFVQSALDGRGDRLKEVLIGLEIFDRSIERYDTRSDPIVRVEVGRIREKLVRYYDGEGASDLFTFAIPVGSYVPLFTRRTRAGAPARRVESFAVMPFTTGLREDETSFAVGLADELIHLLGRQGDVKVVARVSAFKARERNLDAKALGKLLGVTRVIDGSIQRQGERIRCIAHIYRTRDGIASWSQSFDTHLHGRDASGEVDLFAFQDHIAQAVLAAASPTVEPTPTERAAPRGLVAKQRLRARDLVEHASYLSRLYAADQTGKVVALLEEAVALDAEHAQAHVALAVAYLHRATLLQAPADDVLPKARAVLDRAVVLDPNDGEALALRAMIAFRFDFDWGRAERLFVEALRVSPYVSGVNYRYAFGLIFNGRFDEGLRHARLAVDLDPLNLGMRAMAAQLLGYARRYAQAKAEAHAVLELEADHLYTNYVLGQIHLHVGEAEQALARFDDTIARHPTHPSAHLGRASALGLLGEHDAARQALAGVQHGPDAQFVPPYGLAMAMACLRDRPATFTALERAARERDTSFCSVPVDPLFAGLHDDADFVALLTRHGLRTPMR